MFRGSSYVASDGEARECLFCGISVRIGWVKNYRGVNVWVCERCVREGELGAVIATTIFDEISGKEFDRPSKFRKALFRMIDEILDSTRLRVYQDVLNYILCSADFKGLHEESLNEKEYFEPLEKKSGIDIEYEDVLAEEIGEVGGLEGELNTNLELEEKSEEEEKTGVYIEEAEERSVDFEKTKEKLEETSQEPNGGPHGDLREVEEAIPVSNTLPKKEDILRYLDDWKSALDIKREFNAKYMPLLDLLDEMHERGYLLKREDEDKTGGRKYEYKKATGVVYPKKKAGEVVRLWD